MEISLLNTRIIIQKNAVITDEIGNRKNGWTDYFSCFATINGESGGESEVAGQTVENIDAAFTVRWCSETAAVTEGGYRILWNGDIYNINRINHLNNKRKSLKFWCEKVRR